MTQAAAFLARHLSFLPPARAEDSSPTADELILAAPLWLLTQP